VVNTEKWGTASLTSGSFGQTFKITPLQLVRAIASVVNGGYLMEPYLVAEIIREDGSTVLKQEPTVVRQTIRKETSEIMCRLLQSVVEEGTAKNAQVAGFSIGGKTGTSEKIDVFDENGQRVTDKIVSFVGVAPMEDPQYIVLVALDTPSKATGIYISGGVMAAPTVGAVLGDILPYLGVERHYDQEDLASREIVVEDLTGMTRADAEKQLKQNTLTARFIGNGETVTGQIPSAGKTMPGGSQMLVYLGEEAPENLVIVPDLTGMNRAQATEAAGKLGLYILHMGNNANTPDVVVTSQNIPAGTEVAAGSTIQLEFTDTGARD
jgi:stage V sporulation protein D (sporulation-specific penicillin-binding protein)